MNKEKAIEILKRKTKKTREGLAKNRYYGEQFVLEQECEAIETVLNYIEELEKCLNYYKLGDTAEEFEELFGNTPIDDIEKIKKYIFQNYLPKQVILDKIEKLDNNELLGKMNFEQVKFTTDILKEILKGENDEK